MAENAISMIIHINLRKFYLNVFYSFFLYPINVKTTEPIGQIFFFGGGPKIIKGLWIYVNDLNLLPKKFRILENLKNPLIKTK